MLPLRRLEIRQHAKTDGRNDWLSAEGIQQAHDLGRSIRIGYTHLYSDGTQRATQTIACILAGMGRFVQNGVEVRSGLRPTVEAEWHEATLMVTDNALGELLTVNRPLVEQESKRLASEIRAILTGLPEGGYGVAIGDLSLIAFGVYGLTGKAAQVCDGALFSELKGGRQSVDLLQC